ncbi:OsmC family protein [Naasia sp. SYSU D00057]|uniref:OsmC family protein n=1 Tax=Naasia sp. SYSU D00057 TaxID=2817380 RepID=UPI001B30C8CB|nr:OsmC family protein [Naasia sp. SYSU D00057]
MDQQDIKAGVERAREYLHNLPALARYHDTPARATIERDLLVRVSGPGGIPKDMVAGIGDSASVPSPGWYLRAALASSVAMFIAMRSAEMELSLEGLEVLVEAESDDRGALGMSPEIPAGPLEMTIIVRYASSNRDDAATREVIDWAIMHSTVRDAIAREVPMSVAVEHGTPADEPMHTGAG